MSVGYEVYVDGTTDTIETDTKGKVKVLPYPTEKYAHEMCLLEFRGETIEACHGDGTFTTFIYRYGGKDHEFPLEAFFRLLRRTYNGTSIRCVG